MDLENRKDFFVVMFMLGITFASNLAAGFMVGIAVAWVLKAKMLNVKCRIKVFYHLKALKKTERSDSIIRQLSFVIRRFDLYKVYRFGWYA